MRKIILSALLAFFSLSCWAQNLSWGLNVAPGISYRIPQAGALSVQAESVQNAEKSMYVFDFGFDLRKKISHRLSLGTGIMYSQKGFSNTHVATIYRDPLMSRRYYIDYVQDYLEIPFFLTYDVFKNEQIRFYPLGGITNSLLVRARNHVHVTSGEMNPEAAERLSSPYLHNTHGHNFGVIGGLGVMGSVDSRTYLGLEAVGKLMLSPLQDQVSVSSRHLYSLNLNFRFVRTIQ